MKSFKTRKYKHTKILDMSLKSLDFEYELELKFNSWKNGDIELDVVDNKNLNMNIVFINNNEKYIIPKITKILNNIDSNIMWNPYIIKRIKECLSFAKSMEGNLTHDYNIHMCHSKLVFKGM